MSPREKELLSAALRADAWFRAFQPGLALTKTLTAAVAAYDTDDPQSDHEAALARRVAEDGPLPSASRMNFANIGVDDR